MVGERELAGGRVALEVTVRHAGTDSWTDPPAGSQVWELSKRSEARPRRPRLHPAAREPWQETFHQRVSAGERGGEQSLQLQVGLGPPLQFIQPAAVFSPQSCLRTSAK